MLVDLSDRKSNEHAIQRLAAIVESSDDAILTKDLNGIITSWNTGAQRLFGYTAEEAIGKSVTMLIPMDRQDEEPRILSRIRSGERVDHYETIRRRKDGSLVEISISVSPLKNSEGTIVGASKIARDITDRKRAQEQQQLLLREMDHRVKNLFTLASSVVTLSARTADTPEGLAAAIRDRQELSATRIIALQLSSPDPHARAASA
jgi:PAS domain S-box-containing protein